MRGRLSISSQPESDSESLDTASDSNLHRCLCTCGKCCHHDNNEVKHCVRCHANYTFNYPEACWVPHVFESRECLTHKEPDYRVEVLMSACCGHYVRSGESIKMDFEQPSVCAWGWHTTNVMDVEKKYNGINILRCLPGRDGKCMREQLKYDDESELRTYQVISQDDIKGQYTRGDEEDRAAFYKKLAAKHGEEEVELNYEIRFRKRKDKLADDGRLGYKVQKFWQSGSESDDE